MSMIDEEIVDLYWQRDEQAISQTRQKYGRYLFTIAHNILHGEREGHDGSHVRRSADACAVRDTSL